jgi:hypothetical protein
VTEEGSEMKLDEAKRQSLRERFEAFRPRWNQLVADAAAMPRPRYEQRDLVDYVRHLIHEEHSSDVTREEVLAEFQEWSTRESE